MIQENETKKDTFVLGKLTVNGCVISELIMREFKNALNWQNRATYL